MGRIDDLALVSSMSNPFTHEVCELFRLFHVEPCGVSKLHNY